MSSFRLKLVAGCLSAALVVGAAWGPANVSAAPLGSAAVTGAVSPSSLAARIGGVDAYETAAKIAQQGWPTTADTVVLSAGTTVNLIDAAVAAPLAATVKAPILLTESGKALNSYAKQEIQRLKPQTIYVTSGTAVIKPAVLDELKSLTGAQVIELGGYDQYETSINIAKEMAKQGVNFSKVAIAAGWVAPTDALSISSIAGAEGIPVLLTAKDGLPATVKSYLATLKNIDTSYVVGGTAVVSKAVESQLPGQVTRYAGTTQYDTNKEVIKSFDYKYQKTFVANGQTYVDVLAGAPLAAELQAPILLTDTWVDTATRDFVKENLSPDAVVFGGEAVVPRTVVNQLFSAINLNADSEFRGSELADSPQILSDVLKVNGNNDKVKNVKSAYGIYVKGDNTSLTNVDTDGIVFINPGDDGTVYLNNVSAAKIVVLSGGKDSIHLENVKTDELNVQSSSEVHIALEDSGSEASNIGKTVINSSAILDAIKGSFGDVQVADLESGSDTVTFRGTIGTVTVTGHAVLKADGTATIADIVLDPASEGEDIQLVGTFDKVTVNGSAKVSLGANSIAKELVADADFDLVLDTSAKVYYLVTNGNEVATSGDGRVAVTVPDQSQVPDNPTDPDNPKLTGIPGVTITPTSTANHYVITGNSAATRELGLSFNVSAASTLTITYNGETLGTVNLTAGTNPVDGTFLAALNAQKVADILSDITADQKLADGVNFTQVLDALRTSSAADKAAVYDAFYGFLDTVNAQSSINNVQLYTAFHIEAMPDASNILGNAVDAYNAKKASADPTIDVKDLLNPATSGTTLNEINNASADARKAFYEGIDLSALVAYLQNLTEPERSATFSAIDFHGIFNALKGDADAQVQVYKSLLDIYSALITVDADSSNHEVANSIALSKLIDLNQLELTLTSSTGTSVYDFQ